ncbi:BlaI/MecI/CopY family transcriptional regulator, partial [Agathobaculum sp.]|uniref:BlaI/MecI/CopY family transcriptional regulator n=1 Tax=Agathobaculum sp. TaxID=2048138 RepID=UPI003AB47904
SYLIINTLQVIIKTEVRSMKRFKLSNSEEILMDTLWRENRPLTTLQLAEKVTEARWNTNYIDKLLGQLVKKGMVQVSGLLQNGRSRQFVPCYTKDEFLANMLEEQGVNQALFARIAVALFKKPAKSNESEQEEKLIAELEKMVDQYEAALQNKEEK